MSPTPCKELQNNSHLQPSELITNMSTKGCPNYSSIHGIPTCCRVPIIPFIKPLQLKNPITPFMESLQKGSLSFPSWNPCTRDPYLITFPLCCELPSLHCSINFLSHKSPKTSPLSLLLHEPYTLQTTSE